MGHAGWTKSFLSFFIVVCLFLVSLTLFPSRVLANVSSARGTIVPHVPTLPVEDFSLATTPDPTLGYAVFQQGSPERLTQQDFTTSSRVLGQKTVKSSVALTDYFSVLSRVGFFVILILLAAILVEILVVSGRLRGKKATKTIPITTVGLNPVASSMPEPSIAPKPSIQNPISPAVGQTPLTQTASTVSMGTLTPSKIDNQPQSQTPQGMTVSAPLAGLPPVPKRKLDKKTIILILIILFLIITIPLALLLVKQRQEVRKFAGTGSECFEPPRIYRAAPHPYPLNATSSPDDDDWVLYPIRDACANVERLTQIFGPLESVPNLPNVYATQHDQPYQYGFTFNRIMHIDGYDDQQVLQGYPELSEATLDLLHQQNKDVQSVRDCDKNGRQVVFDLSGNDPSGKVAKPNGWIALEPGYYQFDLTPKFQCVGSALHQGSLGAGFIRVVGQVPTTTPTPTQPSTTGTPTPTTTPGLTSTPTPMRTPTPTTTPGLTSTPTPTPISSCGQKQCTTNADCPAEFPYCFDRPSDNVAVKVCVKNTSWYDGCETWACGEKQCTVGAVPNGCPSSYPVCASLAGKGEVCVINALWSDGCTTPAVTATPTIAVPPIPDASFEIPAVFSVIGGVILLMFGFLL